MSPTPPETDGAEETESAGTLTPAAVAQGRRLFRRVQALNALTVAFLMEHMLVLYSLRNGLAESTVAFLASLSHLAMPFMLLGKEMVARRGLAHTWWLTSLIRYLAVSSLIVAGFLTGSQTAAGPETAEAAASGSAAWTALQPVRTALIVGGSALFAILGSMGKVSVNPLLAEVAVGEDRARFIYGSFLLFNLVYLVAMGGAIIAMERTNAMAVYQVLIATALVVGLYTAGLIRRLPESGAGRASARTPLSRILRTLVRSRRDRRLFVAWCAGFATFVSVTPFAVITIKNGYGVPDYMALVFPLFLVLGQIASSMVNRRIADRIGARPMIVTYASGFLGIAAFWAFAPDEFSFPAVAAIFTATGVFQSGIIVGLQHYFVVGLEPEDRVPMSLLVEIGGGATAGLMGSIIGAALLDLLPAWFTGMEVYRGYFRIIIFFVAGFLLLIRRLEPINDWSVVGIVRRILSGKGVRS